jgi:hypothetical protein
MLLTELIAADGVDDPAGWGHRVRDNPKFNLGD